MSFRIVLYGEGVGDLGGDVHRLPAPGEPLEEEHLGPAHHLVSRCLLREMPLPEGALRFVSPLKLRGRAVRGSDLLAPKSLRQLFAWPRSGRRPDIGIVLVDCDGRDERRRELESVLADTILPAVLAVPKQEFEAWLIADHKAVANTIEPPPDQPSPVESLRPREAKALLASWTGAIAPARDARITLARTCALETLDRLESFQAFRRDLAAKVA